MSTDKTLADVQPSFTTGHCQHNSRPGGCQLHNLQCGWPNCDRKAVEPSLADAQPGGMVRLGDQAERARFEQYRGGDFERDAHGYYTNPRTAQDWAMWQAALSAQPSPGGQGDALALIGANLRSIMRLCRPEDYSISRLDAANIHMEARHALQLLDSALSARQVVGEPVEHACTNCDRKHVEAICPTCAGIAWDNGRLHEFHEVRELSTSLGEGVLDHLLPDEWHEKPLLRFQGAYDEGDDSVGISPRSANVLAEDQNGTVLGDYLAARAAKEGGQ